MWLLLTAAGCAVLPGQSSRQPSTAEAADEHTTLGGLAAAAARDRAPGDADTGLVLMPDGVQAWQARRQLIERAQRTLDIQCFSIANDDTGRSFLRLLRDAAARGVRVRLLLDDQETAGLEPLLAGLAASPQVQIRLFNPFPAGRASLPGRYLAAWGDVQRIHRRMHNKLLIADGALAVVGGRNIADEYYASRSGHRYIDIESLVSGRVLNDLAALFDRYWNSDEAWPLGDIVTGAGSSDEPGSALDRLTAAARPPAEALPAASLLDALAHGERRFVWAEARALAEPPDKVRQENEWVGGRQPASIGGSVREALAQLALGARQELLWVSPYVVPTESSLVIIEALRRRGVRMATLTNSWATTDEPLAHAGYRWRREALLRAGVELYELAPPRAPAPDGSAAAATVGRLHAKVAIADQRELYIGSYNLDQRSAFHNTEFGLFVRSTVLAAQAAEVFEATCANQAWRVRVTPAGGLRWQRGRAAGDGGEASAEPDGGDRWPLWWSDLLRHLVPEDWL